MSYSFSVQTATKAEAKTEVAAKLDEIVASQPNHKVDRDAVAAAVNSFVDAIVDPNEDEEITVMVNGSLHWRSEGKFTGIDATTRVYVRPKSL